VTSVSRLNLSLGAALLGLAAAAWLVLVFQRPVVLGAILVAL
jgi:hypothetical protein